MQFEKPRLNQQTKILIVSFSYASGKVANAARIPIQFVLFIAYKFRKMHSMRFCNCVKREREPAHSRFKY